MKPYTFKKLFYQALRKSTLEDNLVVKEAEMVRKRGYPPEEVYRTLRELHDSLVSDSDREVVREALEVIEPYCDDK